MDYQALSDEQLVGIIRETNQELFNHIIQRYNQKLSHYLKKFIYDADELEDVLQDVFIKTFRNLYGFNLNKKFSPWIYRIAHNEAINHIKKYKDKKVPIEDVEFKLLDEAIDHNGSVDKIFLKEKVSLYLGQLKMKYREPLILYYFENRSYEEISQILRVPRNTVGTLISRGKEHLKQIILEKRQVLGLPSHL